MDACQQTNILLQPAKTNERDLQDMVKRVEEVDAADFYFLKRKLSKYISWSLKNGKNIVFIKQNMPTLIYFLFQATWNLET